MEEEYGNKLHFTKNSTNRRIAFEMTPYAKHPTQRTRHRNPAILIHTVSCHTNIIRAEQQREKMESVLFGGKGAPLYYAFFDCDCGVIVLLRGEGVFGLLKAKIS